MKILVVPALSALLLAGLPAHAQIMNRQSVQIARNDSGGDQSQGDTNRSDRGSKDQGDRGNSGTGGQQSQDMHHGDNGSRSSGNTASGAASGGGQSGPFNHASRRDQNAGAMSGGASSVGASQGQTGSRFDHRASRDQSNTRAAYRQDSGSTTGGDNRGTGNFNHRSRSGQNTMATRASQAGSTNFSARPANWNQYPRHFDRQSYQHNTTASRQFRWHSYNRPNGWYYQRWSYGQTFPRLFWAEDYWLTDYWMFDLAIPPYGYVWVRYGDDALLIDRYNGEILAVEYGLFA